MKYGWDFPEEIPEKNSRETPETLSELVHCLPLSTAGDASFFRSGSGEGLSELLAWNSQQY